MLRELVLDALAQAARTGEEHLARRALRGTDPLVRWWLHGRITKRIRWASTSVADGLDRPHVLRLAFLAEAASLDELDFEDRDAVARAFATADALARASGASRKPRRVWSASITLALAIVAVSAGIYRATRPPPRAFDPESTPAGRALGSDLTDYVTMLYRARQADRQRRKNDPASAPRLETLWVAPRERLLEDLSKALTPTAGVEIQDLLASYQRAVLDYGEAAGDARDEHSLAQGVQRANAMLRDAHQPFLLDVLDDLGTGPILTSHYVTKERSAEVDGKAILLLRIQRLDTLNRALSAVGYTRATLGAAAVMRDMVEREIVTFIAPALAKDGRAMLADAALRDTGADWILSLEKRAGEIFREDYASFRNAALDHLVDLVAERDRLFGKFQLAAAYSSSVLPRPISLVTHATFASLEGRVSHADLNAWADIEKELDTKTSRTTFDDLLDRYADRVDRHEIQHQIDFRSDLLTLPEELRATLGLRETMAVDPFGTAARCRDELSADLAAIATDDRMTKTTLVMSTAAVFDRATWPTPHAVGASVILVGLATELAIPTHGRLYASGGFYRQSAAELLIEIAERPAGEIKRAAQGAYAKLFGVAVPPVTWGPWKTWAPAP